MRRISFANRLLFCIAISFLWFASVEPWRNQLHAVLPNEILSDPKLEERARTIGRELRCLQCQNQSIDDSNADIARDLRLLIRRRLVAGDSDEEIRDYVVSRYGEYILFRPRFTPPNYFLWLGPFFLLLLGAIGLFLYVRKAALDTPQTDQSEKKPKKR